MVDRDDSRSDGHQVDDWSAQALRAFLRTAWGMVVDEDGDADGYPSWIDPSCRSRREGSGPVSAGAGAGAGALGRVLACGVDPDDLTDVVREMQHALLYNLCQLIDDPGLLGIGLGEEPSEPAEFRWELMAVRTRGTEEGAPAERVLVQGLHSSLDGLDPSGREGESRGRPVPARLPGHPLHARLAVAHARAGERVQAINTWRTATGAPVMEAKAAIDRLLEQVGRDPESVR
ncbi:hypothetical protein GCM10009665_17400 [Kitasatospora nipponensis]|uniref:Uncharacterized protein n=1 Tax=Kitasatospora nipponensis TaxID=258049 RepID=A0ABN1VYA1_9ACTN